MGVKLPSQADSVLNMTPMIDIVFQLILFFLLNLRFKSLDYRIETQLPRDRGIQATNQIVEDIPSIKVLLFRLNEDDPSKASTKIKVGGTPERIFGPYVWTGERKHDQAVEDLRDSQFREITALIGGLFKQNPKLKGEIETPPPKGASVPHGDIMRVLGCFLEAGVAEVNFGGAPAPLPKAKGGHGP
jgi:hypothetical protein